MEFNSRRSQVLARRGMVATSQPLAAMAGLRMLLQGGNAVDGAVAAAAALNVVEPMATGVGGDAFALVWMAKDKKAKALNAGGRAPAAASINELRNQGFSAIPSDSPWAVCVPGTVDGWHTILRSCGTMPLSEVLKPAIEYAEEGYPVSEVIANQWQANLSKLSQHPSGQEFLLNGNPPREGDVVRLPGLAGTLRSIAEGGPDAFYRGPMAQIIADFVGQEGGWLSAQDLASHASTWEEPISTDYRGLTCWECPPNGQGLIALTALNIAEGFDFRSMGFQSADTYHHLIESVRLAMADGLHYIADPATTHVPTAQLLSKTYAEERRALIRKEQALPNVEYGNVQSGHDTVYVTCIDSEGNACSFINSILSEFGTGLVVPGTGIVLHNRAALFSLDIDHPNALQPGKRPFHTIIPAIATRGGELCLSFGVMGRFQQAQGHLQVLVNMVDFDMNPQAALDALRFNVREDGIIGLEEGVSPEVVGELERRSHSISVLSGYPRTVFGGGQVIERDLETGVLSGGSDPRKDGCAVGW
ncbi:gamma-glutamyltransferase [SAR202 cluster bacterium AC-647-N09_OGT_505m]|nr:gamma-glutamyltransferase [SAR202 cluster bacterium AC-647-N09_OGT_505m]